MELGDWRIDTVSGGDFSIDGGAVFGVVPKTVWETIANSDEQNRVRLRNNCVLLRDGRHTVLIDTGYGGKYSPLDRAAYAMEEGNPIVSALQQLNVSPDQIDTVVLSHLHFDHAGGITSFDGRRNLTLTFPNAQHVIGRHEWEDATSRSPELLAAYPQNNLQPLQNSSRLTLLGDDQQIVPGLRPIRTGGHTRGHLAFHFEAGGQTLFLPGDLIPTSEHIRPLWCLAYDTFLLVTRQQKPKYLAQAAEEGWLVAWAHDPKYAVSRLCRRSAASFGVSDCSMFL